MQYTTLGKTGLKVSVAGLGCGGFSRLGLGTGKSTAEAVALIRQALDMGVNLLDTAAVYGTEAVVGEAIKAVPRESVVVATKAWIPYGGGRRAAERAVASLDASLRRLGTDYVDIFQLHGVAPEGYAEAREVIGPALLMSTALKPDGSLILSSGSLSTDGATGGVGIGLRLLSCLLVAGLDLSIGLKPGWAMSGPVAAISSATLPAKR